jgi:lysophospholipid acyltransferase (LPLAT)-like uncharacterized protein
VKISRKIDSILTSKAFIGFLYRFIRLYSSTFRLTVENESAWMTHLKGGNRVLLCAWHQQFFGAIHHFRNYRHLRPGLMISRSKDGEIIAGVAQRTGWETVRGSSSRGGREAMKEIINKLKETGLAAHVVDGPQGPAGIVKNGLIAIAHATGALVVPFYVSADRAWFFNSWDRFMLPKPFSRVTIRFDDPIALSPAANETEFEAQRQAVEQQMLPSVHLPPGKAAS